MMYQSPIAQKIEPIIQPSLEAMGYDVVRIHWQEGKRPTLQIMADRSDKAEMTVEDCAEISHTVSALLDVEDPIESAYELEVSSPGIDRPLTRIQDFTEYSGFEAKIEMLLPIEGRKRFRGRLVEVDADNCIAITVDNAEWRLPYRDIYSAKLVMNDELVRESLRRSKQRQSDTAAPAPQEDQDS